MCYTLLHSRFILVINTWGSTFNITTRPLESLISRAISLIMDNSSTKRLQTTLRFIQFKGVYDYFVLCKMFRIICEQKHKHFTQKTYIQLKAHNHKTRSRVNNKLVLPRYSKSNCQNTLIFGC